MNRRQVNIQDAGLPAALTPEQFVTKLREWQQMVNTKKAQAAQVDPIHGTIFSRNEPQKKIGTQGTEIAGVT